MQKIDISPIPKFTRTLVCAPDKSITHRAVMFNAAAKGKAEVRGMLLGQDCLSTIDCMRRLGASIEQKGDNAVIAGTQGFASAKLDCGNSGTTMRLLSGLAAARAGTFTLFGDQSLSSRPMRRVIDPLTAMGAQIASQEGKAPLCITGQRLHGIDYVMPVASAQVKSAVLLAGLGAEGVTRVTEKERTRDHTEILLRHMGVRITRENDCITLEGDQTLHAADVCVAGDISSAAFPLVCGLITGGRVCVHNVGLNPTRTGLLEVFDQIGADYEVADIQWNGGEKTGTVCVRGLGHGRPFAIGHDMIPRLVDEIPVLAVLACYLSGESVVTGAQELRVKESDRIAATVRLVRAFGGDAQDTPDGLIVRGVGQLAGGCTFDPALDHRMAMSAAVAAAASKKGGTVLSPACAAVSYPHFWRMLAGEQ